MRGIKRKIAGTDGTTGTNGTNGTTGTDGTDGTAGTNGTEKSRMSRMSRMSHMSRKSHMPEGWKMVNLGEVSVDGGHYGIGAPAVEYDDRLPTYLRITDIRDDGSVCKEGLKSVDSEEAEEYYLKPNDLVIARTGASTGRNYFYDGRDGNLVYAGFLIKFSIDENKIWPPYVKYWFKGNEYRSWLNNHTDGSTRANINAVTLAECPIRVPESLPTQRKIAAVLGAIDDKIENNRKICANLEAQAQALFKSWFVDFEPFGGKMPDGWKMGKLGEVAEITSGKRPPTRANEKDCENRYPLLGASCIMGYTSEFMYEEPILVTGRVGTHGVIQRSCEKCWPSDNTLVLKAEYYEFVYQLLLKVDYSLMNRGSTQPLITQSDLKGVAIIRPDETILKEFEGRASTLMSMILEKDRQSRALAELRDALLPRLMSGEIDVSEVAV